MGKLQEIHLLRAFGALGVVLLHTLALSTDSNLNFIRNFLGYVVPIFVFISGFVLSYSFKPEYTILSFYKKRFSGIILPYLIFANLYYFYAIFRGYIPEHRLDFTHYIGDVMLAKTYYHLWFFCILFQFYLLFPFIFKFYKKFENKSVLILLFCFGLQLFWAFLSDMKPRANLGLVFICFLFYFILGIYFSRNYTKIFNLIKKIKLIFPLTLFLALNWIIFQIESVKFFLAPISFVSAFWLFLRISNLIISKSIKDKQNIALSFLNQTATFSLGIYLVHVFCIDLSIYLVNNLFKDFIALQNQVIFFGLVYFSSVILAFSFCKILSKYALSKNILGVSK